MFDIIILNYKALEKLKRCLAAVRKYTPHDHRITVVDNENSAASQSYLKTLQGVQVLSPFRNLGSSAGTNLAFRNTDREWIVLLDDDAIVQRGWLKKMHKLAQQDERNGIVACKVLFPDKRVMSAEYLVHSLTAVGYGERDLRQRDYERTCDVVIRTCLLMRRALLSTVGYLDEDFFPGQYETMDYCLRARLAGHRILYTGKTAVIHDHLFRGGDDFYAMEALFLQKWKDRLPSFPLKDSHPADFHLAEGFRMLEQKEYEAALLAFQKAEKIDRRFAQPFYKATALYRLGNYGEAVRSFRKAVRLMPHDIVPRHQLALCYKKLGKTQRMKMEADQVLDYFSQNVHTTRKTDKDNSDSDACIEIDASRRKITYRQ